MNTNTMTSFVITSPLASLFPPSSHCQLETYMNTNTVLLVVVVDYLWKVLRRLENNKNRINRMKKVHIFM